MEILEILWKITQEYAEGTHNKLPKVIFYLRTGADTVSGYLTNYDPRSGLFTFAQKGVSFV